MSIPPTNKHTLCSLWLCPFDVCGYMYLSHAIFPHVDCLLVCCARGRGLFDQTFFLDGRSGQRKSTSQSALRVCVYTYTYSNMFERVYVCVFVYTHTYSQCVCVRVRMALRNPYLNIYVHMVCVCVCICECVFVCTCM